MTGATLTPAQRRALDWLPSNGEAASEHPDFGMDEFHRLWKLKLVQVAPVSITGEGHVHRFRLTPAGIALKAQMEETNG